MTILTAATLLFLVMDPFGNVPFFLAALKNVDRQRQNRVIVRELVIALAALLLFLFSGPSVLALLGISEPALALAGGVILFLIAIRMIFPASDKSFREEFSGEPFVVPLAIPYVAGPSALATELVITSREPERWAEWLLALLLAWLASGLIIYSGSQVRAYLSDRFLIAVERLMGMVLIAVSIQMLINGIKVAFQV